MGSSQSSQAAEAERARRADLERKRKLDQEEQERLEREMEANRQKQLEDEAKIRKLVAERKRLEAEAAQRSRDHTHDEEMKKIENLEKCEERKDTLNDAARKLEHDRLMDLNTKTFELAKIILGKVGNVDMNEAAYGMTIAQAVQTGKTVDKEVLGILADKVPSAPPLRTLTSPYLKQIVEQVIDTYDDREEDSRRNQMLVSNEHSE